MRMWLSLMSNLRPVMERCSRAGAKVLVRLFWGGDDNYRGKRWVSEPVDAFWVEATADEAEAVVFPHLQAAAVDESRDLAEDLQNVAEQLGTPARPFCFLVARDLSFIDPFPARYPYHQLWNAYSPFESMPDRMISSLEELQTLRLP